MSTSGGAPGVADSCDASDPDAIPKLVAHQLLAPALRVRSDNNETMAIVCREGSPQSLLPSLLTHELDLLLADTPQPPAAGAAVYSHLLGKSPVSFFGRPELLAGKRKAETNVFAVACEGSDFRLRRRRG